ncbi:MAG: hypothetical protein GY757_43165 [bacterium]|nr:hypothetical protein [bacterium]
MASDRWDATTNISTERKCRHADVYVFCLLDHKVQAAVDPLNMNQWRFYILPTVMLDKKVGNQKTIRLNPLLKLEPLEAKYGEISKAINKVLSGGSAVPKD